jgi:hypothetical protein
MSEDRDLPAESPGEYEPPRIEVVLTDERLAREVQYAAVSVE